MTTMSPGRRVGHLRGRTPLWAELKGAVKLKPQYEQLLKSRLHSFSGGFVRGHRVCPGEILGEEERPRLFRLRFSDCRDRQGPRLDSGNAESPALPRNCRPGRGGLGEVAGEAGASSSAFRQRPANVTSRPSQAPAQFRSLPPAWFSGYKLPALLVRFGWLLIVAYFMALSGSESPLGA